MRKARALKEKPAPSPEEQDFLSAVRRGDVAAIQASLAKAPCLAKVKTTAGAPALALAAAFGRAESVRALLADPGSDANARDAEGSTALMVAVGYGHGRDECGRLLLPASDARAANANGETALMFAVRRRAPEVVADLLGASDANAVNQEGRTALMLAAEQGDAQCAALLIPFSAAGAAVPKAAYETLRHPKTAAWLAAENGHLEVVKLFLGPKPEFDPEANPRGAARLAGAGEEGQGESRSAEANSDKRSAQEKKEAAGALDAALKKKHWGIADFLCAEGYVGVEEAQAAFQVAPRGGMPMWERRFAEWEAGQLKKEMRAGLAVEENGEARATASNVGLKPRKPKAL